MLGLLGMSPVARADANGGIAAAMALTAADGSVRTQAGVRLSISAVPGARSDVRSLSQPVQARMSELRACFGAAMLRAPTTEGRAEFELEAGHHGARVRVLLDETHDPELVSCMKSSLARTQVARVPRGARAVVGLYLSNPLAGAKRRMAEAAPLPTVRMLAGGRAESTGGTQEGEIKFRVMGSAYATSTIAAMQHDISSQLAGLLDCRRKVFRRERDAHGTVEIALSVRDGTLRYERPRSSLRASAPHCVAQWLDRLDARQLSDADLALAISFAP